MAKIYISSTFEDLKNYREAVYKFLRQWGHDIIAMEDYVATDERPLDKCLKNVSDCEIYIGLVAWRYGYIPHKQKKSITELEYECARHENKTCLIFILDEKALWPAKFVDKDITNIKNLRQKLQTDHQVSFFETAEDLKPKLSVYLKDMKISCVQLITQGVNTWNKWRVDNPGVNINLSGADLNGLDLRGANLTGANLSGADLNNADFIGADLNGANLKGANLSEANFSGANLNKTDLVGFINDYYYSVDHYHVNFQGANLNSANLSKNRFIDTNFSKSTLENANLERTNLRHCNLSSANLRNCNLSYAELSGSTCENALIDDAFFFSIEIEATNFKSASINRIKNCSINIKQYLLEAGAICENDETKKLNSILENTKLKLKVAEEENKRYSSTSIPAIPLWQNRNFEVEEDICFVIMPFKKEKNLNYVYNNHIKKIIENFHLKCIRADDIFKNEMIMEDIWEQICTAKFIIGDLTDKNPNVFYELGMAHTLGKRVILITQSEDDVPFDLRHLRYIKYEFTPPGIQNFEDLLKKAIDSILKS